MQMISHYYRQFILSLLLLMTFQAKATTYDLFSQGNSLIGRIQFVSAYANDSTTALAQRYNLGLNSIIDANPGLVENSVLPDGGSITVPTAFILPPLARKGIIINLPEMRLYYFPPNTNTVMTFPIGIGRIGKTIPITNTAIIRKVTNPVWIPTPDIREFNRKQGIDLPHEMPPGPDNPLGPYAIYLRVPTYLIHSTIFPESIGRRASFGCIRMNESDIKEFFPLVTPGTPVAIIDMPIKVGWENNYLYLQAYPSLQERAHSSGAKLNESIQLIENAIAARSFGLSAMVNWQMVAYLAEQPDGIPHEVGFVMGNS